MKKFAALALSSTLSCAPFGAHAQGYPQLKGPGGTLVAPAPMFASNPACPNGGVNGVPALGVAGPGIVGQSYLGTVCPSPGSSGSGTTTILGQDGVNPVSSTNPLPVTGGATNPPITFFSNQTLAGGTPYTSTVYTVSAPEKGQLACTITNPNGAAGVLQSYSVALGNWVNAKLSDGVTNFGCATTVMFSNLPIPAGTQVRFQFTGGTGAGTGYTVTLSQLPGQ